MTSVLSRASLTWRGNIWLCMKMLTAVHHGCRKESGREALCDHSRHRIHTTALWTTGTCGLWRVEVGYSHTVSLHSWFIYRKTCVARTQGTPVAAGRQLRSIWESNHASMHHISWQVKEKAVTYCSDENLWGVWCVMATSSMETRAGLAQVSSGRVKDRPAVGRTPVTNSSCCRKGARQWLLKHHLLHLGQRDVFAVGGKKK